MVTRASLRASAIGFACADAGLGEATWPAMDAASVRPLGRWHRRLRQQQLPSAMVAQPVPLRRFRMQHESPHVRLVCFGEYLTLSNVKFPHEGAHTRTRVLQKRGSLFHLGHGTLNQRQYDGLRSNGTGGTASNGSLPISR